MWPKPQLGRVWRSPMFIIGTAMMIVGATPLLLFGVLWYTADPNPNPVGLGILFTFLFWPGFALALAAFGRFAGPRGGPALSNRSRDDVDRVA